MIIFADFCWNKGKRWRHHLVISYQQSQKNLVSVAALLSGKFLQSKKFLQSFEISMTIALILQRSLSESSRSLIILLQGEEHNADSGKQIL